MWRGYSSHFTIIFDASELAKRYYIFWAALCSWHPTVGFWSNGPDFSSRFGQDKIPIIFSLLYKGSRISFSLFFIAVQNLQSIQTSKLINHQIVHHIFKKSSKIFKNFENQFLLQSRKFSLRISLSLLGQPPRPVIFSSTYSEWVGLSV